MNRANINLKNPQLLIMFFIVFALFTTMCVTITGVTQPETAQVNERINITIDVEVNPAENASYNLIFGFLANMVSRKYNNTLSVGLANGIALAWTFSTALPLYVN